MPIIAKRITEAAFAPYGAVISHQPGVAIADASAAFSGGERAMQPVLEWVQLTTSVVLPTLVDKVEHHPFSDQTFLPHSQAPFLVVVCPARTDGSPDGEKAEAFVVPATNGVTFRRGVWHRSLAPLTAPSAFTMSMARTGRGDDTVIAALDRPVEVIAD